MKRLRRELMLALDDLVIWWIITRPRRKPRTQGDK